MSDEGIFEKGMKLRELHRFKAAAGFFHEIRKSNPNSAEAWFWEAVSLDNRGNEKDAIPCYIEALRLGVPDSLLPKAYLWLSSSYSREGDWKNSDKYLRLAEENGDYEPPEEFEFISGKIRKRNKRLMKLKKRE